MFRECARSLGSPVTTTDIKLEPGSAQVALRPEPFFLHMDSPVADYVAWYVMNDGGNEGCPMMVADSRSAINSLPAETLKKLQATETFYIDHASGARVPIPLVGRDRHGNYFARYFPYYLQNAKAADGTATQAVLDLEACLASLPKQAIPFTTRDIVIVDNRRMMHGRSQLRPTSTRHLFRVWIHSGEALEGRPLLQQAAHAA